MARSFLERFVGGTRQILAVQLVVAIGTIALAGWTLGVTSELIRERDRLRERVIQLEETMGNSGIVVPEPPTAVVDAPTYQPASSTYPAEIGVLARAEPSGATAAVQSVDESAEPEQRNLGRLLGDLFASAPPMRLLVLHVRADADSAAAEAIADELEAQGDVRVVINVLQPRDPRAAGYTYFDGRQGRAAAALVTRFHELAREKQLAAWSAQLRGVALPATGEFTADRLDLVLPQLPAPAPAVPAPLPPAVTP